MELSTAETAKTNRSLSESESFASNVNNLSTSPRIRVTPPTPRFCIGYSHQDSFGSSGSLPRPDCRPHNDAWKQLNDELNQIFPKRCCSHVSLEQRRTSLRSFPSKKSLEEDDHQSDVYHTIYGGRNNPLTASRALGPFSKIVRRRISSSPSNGILQVLEKNSSSSSSLTSLNSMSPSIDPMSSSSSYFNFAPVAVSQLTNQTLVEVIGLI